MTQGSNDLHFFYDASNKPAVVIYNGTAYAYVKNLQGDIIAILDQSGNVVVSYAYDAWGKPISTTGSMATTLGAVQPFRYRGYVFDQEIGLYYLHSRYYNPIWCRFNILDSTEMLGAEDVHGNNLFVYCQNNPFNRTDPTGTWSWSSFFDTACNVVGTVAAVVSATAIIVGTGGTAAVVVLGAACGGLIGGYYNEKAGGHYSSGFVGGVVSSLVQTYAGKFFGPCGTWLGGAFGSGLGTCVAGAMDNMYLPADERKSGADIWNATQRTFAVALVTSGVTALMGSGFQYAYETNGIDGLMVGMDEAFANIGNQFFGSVDDAITYMLLMENE